MLLSPRCTSLLVSSSLYNGLDLSQLNAHDEKGVAYRDVLYAMAQDYKAYSNLDEEIDAAYPACIVSYLKLRDLIESENLTTQCN